MQTILISPYSKPLRNGKQNPKNYPFWSELVSLLVRDKYKVIQIGVTGEEVISQISSILFNSSLSQLRDLVNGATTWIAIDNFFPHFATIECKKSGVVLFGKSDPKIFGHLQNINLLKERKYLRSEQWKWWEEEEYNPEVFVSPQEVYTVVKENFPYASTK